jgi:hypothetical protein
VVLRDRFEGARRNADRSRAMAAVQEVRSHVLLAISIVKEKLGPIERAAAESDVESLLRTYPDWNAERHLLDDEVRELERLLDHIELVLNATA